MIFSSFQYLFFLIIVLALVSLNTSARYRKLVLLLASYYFYAYWDYRFVFLLLASTTVDFLLGLAIKRTETPARRKLLFSISLLFNLGLLGFFKYYNFFVDSADAVLAHWGVGISNLNIILPIAISFYTFETISYTFDVYRRELEPVENYWDFALFLAFFPHMIAGPILRAADFLPQLRRPITIKSENIWAGSQIFMVGLFKKLMIADAVAPFINHVFAHPAYFSSVTVWMAVLAYALQIYCDFSGYSDMAIGSARIFGLHFPRNFNMPYLSKNVAEFWYRWHISLSSWLRDYVYRAFGGNRKGPWRTYINLLITMLLGGLWHGASWNFVIWGAVHGVALIVQRAWSTRFHQDGRVFQVLNTLVTFLFVTVVWVLFWAQDMTTVLTVYQKLLFINAAGAAWYYSAFFVAASLAIIGHIIGYWRAGRELVFFNTPYSYQAAFSIITLLLIIYLFAPTNLSPFIYFQF